jgi:lipopolysaccharide/colanic/teichoic acid biosynthesis glycosyltransferase
MFEDVEGTEIVATSSLTRQPLGGLGKRSFDVVVALCAIVALLPLIAAVCLLLKWNGDGSVFFKQMRVGFGGRRFACYKFRSMVENADMVLEQFLRDNPEARAEWETCQKLRNDPRITPLGQFLRSTSMDELPQLFNILIGDMSIVGPRPIIQSEIARYGVNFSDYAAGRPGLTGLWQVSGRSDCTYPERVALDCQYVREWDFWLDLRIIAKTFNTVLTRRGSY